MALREALVIFADGQQRLIEVVDPPPFSLTIPVLEMHGWGERPTFGAINCELRPSAEGRLVYEQAEREAPDEPAKNS